MRRFASAARSAALAAALGIVVVSVSGAQRASRPTPFAAAQASTPAATWTIGGGIATGDAGYDLGFVLQGSYKTTPPDWPVSVRIDPFIGRWTGGDEFNGFSSEFSLTMIGVQGNAAYDFPVTGGRNWFVFGGVGIFYRSVSFDENLTGFDETDSSTDLGIGIGGGLNFGQRFVLEAQFKSIGTFSTVPILFGIRL